MKPVGGMCSFLAIERRQMRSPSFGIYAGYLFRLWCDRAPDQSPNGALQSGKSYDNTDICNDFQPDSGITELLEALTALRLLSLAAKRVEELGS